MMSPSRCNPEGSHQTPKRVTFRPIDTVYTIPRLGGSDATVHHLFYTDEEYRRIRRASLRTIERMEEESRFRHWGMDGPRHATDRVGGGGGGGGDDDDDVDSCHHHCTRGLEWRTAEGRRRRRHLQRGSIQAVLDEQAIQAVDASWDPELLAAVYRSYSIPAAEEARWTARRDEVSALRHSCGRRCPHRPRGQQHSPVHSPNSLSPPTPKATRTRITVHRSISDVVSAVGDASRTGASCTGLQRPSSEHGDMLLLKLVRMVVKTKQEDSHGVSRRNKLTSTAA